MSTDSKTPRTDEIFKCLAKAMLYETGYEHFAILLKVARSGIEDLETDVSVANARIAELEKLVSEMTHNQRMQDSITAQVMERAEKAEAVNASLREYCRLCDIKASERKK